MDTTEVRARVDKIDPYIYYTTHIKDFFDYLVVESSALSSVAKMLLDSRNFEKLKELLLEAK